jgi:hypothetical protein
LFVALRKTLLLPMSPALLIRIRGEYREMPGLRLTLPQACRLWQLDAATCKVVLQTLIEEGFLIGRQDGTFIALPSLKAVKADILCVGAHDSA